MSFIEAWAAYNAKDYVQAERLFEARASDDYPEAMHGLIRTYLAQGETSAAHDLALRLVDFESTPQAVALLGQAVGAEGKRKQAEEYLKAASTKAPNDAFIRVVLGEQRIRRGKWDMGAADFVAGLSAGHRRNDAFHHVREVIADLILAVIAGKIPDADAMKFVNQVAYNVTGKTPEMDELFGAARRAIAERAPLADTPRRRPAPSRRPQAPLPQRPQAPLPQRPQAASPKSMSDPARLRRTIPQPTAPASSRPTTPQRPRTDLPEPRGNAKLLHLIRHDRRENEKLQETVLQVGLPVWPSKLSGLDTLPNLRPKILGRTADEMKQAQMRLSEGSIASEIVIRRGLEAILQRAAEGGRPPEPTIRGVARLELMCWDGLLGNISDLAEVYLPENTELPVDLLALGAFLGTSVARRADARWRFSTNPLESSVVLKQGEFQPFQVARRWLAAPDKDEVDLVQTVADAAKSKGVDDLGWVDTTHGVTERALKLRLAEVWTAYRWRARTVPVLDIAESMEIILDHENAIVFTLDAAHAPKMARGPQDVAVRRDGAVILAYVRGTGDFLVPSSKKHLVSLLSVLFGEIEPGNMSGVLQALALFYRPSMGLVEAGPDTQGPEQIRSKAGALGVRFMLRGGGREERLQLIQTPGRMVPWRLESQ